MVEQAPVAMHVQVLGRFRVLIGGKPVPDEAWKRHAGRTLFKLLAITPGHRLQRDQVLELLWPDLSPDSGLNSLRKALHAAREALEPDRTGRGASSYIQMQSGVVALDGTITVDADQFEDRASGALASGGDEHIASALKAYTGPVLPEDLYEDWSTARRATVAELRLRLLRRQAESLRVRGEPERAAEVLAALVADDPTDETTHLELMRLYAEAGSRHRVLRQYQILRDVLDRELGVEPDAETQTLYQAMLGASTRTIPRTPTDQASVLPRLLRRQPATPLVGRQRVTAVLEEAAQRARLGDSGTLLVSGEAGVGKTRLVADLARRLAADGMRVLWGSSYGNDVPYGPFVDAIEDGMAQLPPEERAMIAAQYPELAPLIPSLRLEGQTEITRNGQPGSSDVERARLFAAVVRLLSDRASGGPLLLVLDDLHMADAASVHLLQHIMRSSGASSWLVIGTYREGDVEPSSDLHSAIVTGTREGFVRAVSLLRLGREDVDQLTVAMLTDAPVDRSLLDQVWNLTLGNPLFLSELVRSMRERGEIGVEGGAWRLGARDESYVPERVSDLVAERVGRMGADVAHALNVASVAGMESSFDVLRDATGIADSSLLDALDRALDARILEERGAGYAFRHPLMRTALYERLSGRRRGMAHGAVAQAIERATPDAVDDLAYHYALSPDIDRAIVYLERAGDRAERIYANETAERSFRRAIELLEGRRIPTDSIRMRMKLSSVLHTSSRYAEAQEELYPALEMSRQVGNRERFIEIAGQIATFYSPLSRYQEGLDFLQRTLPDLDNLSDSPAIGRVYLAKARLNYRSARFLEAYAAAARAVALVRAGDDEGLLVESLLMESLSMRLLWSAIEDSSELDPRITLEHSDRISEEALAICERRGDLTRMLPIVGNLATFAHWRGDLPGYVTNAERRMDLAGRVGASGHQALARSQIGHALVLIGEMERGMPLLEDGVQRARSLDAMVQHSIPFIHLGIALTMRGEWEEAIKILDEARSVAPGDTANVQIAAGHQARIALERGNPEEARRILAHLEKEVGLPLDPEAVGRSQALTWAESGEPEEAERLLLDVVVKHRRMGSNLFEAEHLIALGGVRLLRGDSDGAIEALERTRTLAAPMPYPYLEAQALYLQALATGPSSPEAEGLLRPALAIFQRLRARPYIERAEVMLARFTAAQ